MSLFSLWFQQDMAEATKYNKRQRNILLLVVSSWKIYQLNIKYIIEKGLRIHSLCMIYVFNTCYVV